MYLLFQTYTLKRLREPLIVMMLIASNLGYLKDFLSRQQLLHLPPFPSTTADNSKKSFWLCFSKLINYLL